MKQTLFLLVNLLWITLNIEAATYNVQGRITDARTGEAVSYATATLKLPGSDQLLKGAVSDESGEFTIGDLKAGDYHLVISFIGYKDLIRDIHIVENTNLGNLSIEEDSQVLGEVQVVGQKAQMKFELDKKVFNVEQNLSSIGGTASDVLTQIPSVEVDHEGQVSLRGNSNVTVWINGKASGLSSENRGDILRQLPSESIERVEVVTNPSSKYSSEGSAGIINIILKRDRRSGYFGSIQTGADNSGGYNASGNINYSSGKLEAFANVGYRHNVFRNGGYSDRYALDGNSNEISLLHQENTGKMTGNYTMLRGGLTWLPTSKDRFSLSGMAWLGGYRRNNTTDYLFTESVSDGYSRQRLQHEDADHDFYNVELGYKHDFSESSSLDFTATYSYMDLGMTIDYDDRTTDHAATSTLFQRQGGGNQITTWDAQLDYTKRWSNGSQLEAGYKGTWQRNNSPVSLYTGQAKTDLSFDADRYNRFLYNQDVHAAYLTYGGKIGNFSYQGGLRGEYTRITGQPVLWDVSIGGEMNGTSYDNDYFRLFPSAFLSYALPHGNEIQLNYTRRITRPGVLQLNSFRNITDATNISYGNPELTPSYTNAFELNYIKSWDNHTLSASAYYRTSDDIIQQIRFMGEGNVMYSTFENVSQSQSAGLELVGKNNLFRILDLTSTANLFYYKLDGFNFRPAEAINEVFDDGNENFAWNARIIANTLLPWGLSFQVTGNYNSRQVIAQGSSEASFSMDAGLRKSFMDRTLNIAISARDLFNSRKWKSHTSGTSFRQYAENWWGGRYIGLTLSWSFGNMKTKRDQMPIQENIEIPTIM